MLGSRERGHGIGQVEVSSNAELALHGGRIWRCGCQERFFTGFLINSGQIRVNQGIKELHYELSVVWDLCLLWGMGEKKINQYKNLFLFFLLFCQYELCPRTHSNTTLVLPKSFKKHLMGVCIKTDLWSFPDQCKCSR